ncbi:MAG TPA: hypothetical protein DCR43_09190 [Bacteroidales bacterium]|nr:MAG: hypothetical protein A2X11_05310 [Bacteroidetes bacterium GWE2_42_24]OFY26564.1 MAG: hypothetical protein A2X09_03255 [Bacteroidetes bacterium GWF2_43_11]PKP27420.1 MAG: hypothetical protein CVU06_02075 [Bacteroidetes bacterium HGW-Bacteroidetes-22]HAQ66008.1 hypothetical protein [Bacteroidales bacterium]HBZ67443.1 hypothetical protein [Bacteroidales bacterium]
MSILRFKTNINCGNCLRSVTPFLNREPDIEKWQVDLEHPDRVLTVEGEMGSSLVTDLLKEAGFSGELLT